MIPKIVPEALQRLDTNEVWFVMMSIAFRYGWHGTGSFVLIFGLLLLVWLDGVAFRDSHALILSCNLTQVGQIIQRRSQGGSFLSVWLLTTDSS